ncbi:uncharacterized protein SCHCODRAFT_01238931 [Schizophyllum commune H4-8]|uniref:uncharacterized protein n=1 Tax=Schizophyllum commune (strain H4-8 / FGSC 9210) TaxID=578458 RepID=UPI0021601738|nr:uncharacterized protein SCHCODRAFT_01238931 [Schizophyllum commune H4-8]KAI5887516.1 hypothetical protein SCHCODRAFT_01238931 [Schizophyllum commune H4-8]
MLTEILATIFLATTALASGSTECTRTTYVTSTTSYPGATTTAFVDGGECSVSQSCAVALFSLILAFRLTMLCLTSLHYPSDRLGNDHAHPDARASGHSGAGGARLALQLLHHDHLHPARGQPGPVVDVDDHGVGDNGDRGSDDGVDVCDIYHAGCVWVVRRGSGESGNYFAAYFEWSCRGADLSGRSHRIHCESTFFVVIDRTKFLYRVTDMRLAMRCNPKILSDAVQSPDSLNFQA